MSVRKARTPLTAGQKAARTKGKAGLKLAGAKAAVTRLSQALKGTRGETRAALSARIASAQERVQALTA